MPPKKREKDAANKQVMNDAAAATFPPNSYLAYGANDRPPISDDVKA
jgi:hypothetical protein